MKLTAQFNGSDGPVWLEVTDVLEISHRRWGGYAKVLVKGLPRVVDFSRLRVEA